MLTSRVKHKPVVAPRTAALLAELDACLKREAFYISQQDGQSLLEQMSLKSDLIAALQQIASQRPDPWLNEQFRGLVAQQTANAAALQSAMENIEIELGDIQRAQNKLQHARQQSRSASFENSAPATQFWA